MSEDAPSILPRCESCRRLVTEGVMFRVAWNDGRVFDICVECCPTPGMPEYTITSWEVAVEVERYLETMS